VLVLVIVLKCVLPIGLVAKLDDKTKPRALGRKKVVRENTQNADYQQYVFLLIP
jgi:hypothetical protein